MNKRLPESNLQIEPSKTTMIVLAGVALLILLGSIGFVIMAFEYMLRGCGTLDD